VVLPHLKPNHLNRVYPKRCQRSRVSSFFNQPSKFVLSLCISLKRRNYIQPCSQGIRFDLTLLAANSAYHFYQHHHKSLVEDSHHQFDDLNNHSNHHHNQRSQKMPHSKKASVPANPKNLFLESSNYEKRCPHTAPSAHPFLKSFSAPFSRIKLSTMYG
jgi:hypothetical protein